MPTPKTLLDFSGACLTAGTLSDSVILVVDAQKEYTEGSLRLAGIDKSVDALEVFLNRARQQNTPIIHIVHTGNPGGNIMASDGPFTEIIDQVKPVEGEPVISKKFPSSFTNTNLQEEIEKTGRKKLIITGYMTHMCVNSTTRDATESGYLCTIVEELTATRDLPDGNGGVINAEIVKKVNLASLADRFAIVVGKAEDIA